MGTVILLDNLKSFSSQRKPFGDHRHPSILPHYLHLSLLHSPQLHSLWVPPLPGLGLIAILYTLVSNKWPNCLGHQVMPWPHWMALSPSWPLLHGTADHSWSSSPFRGPLWLHTLLFHTQFSGHNTMDSFVSSSSYGHPLNRVNHQSPEWGLLDSCIWMSPLDFILNVSKMQLFAFPLPPKTHCLSRYLCPSE